MSDLRYAFRQLGKHLFANGVIVLTIALLICAVSVIYASIRDDATRYAPFPDRDRVLKLWRIGEKKMHESFPADLYHDYAERLTSFEELGAAGFRQSATLTEVGEPFSYGVVDVSASLLRLTQVTPMKGRLFLERDEKSAEDSPILISEWLWRAKLDADEQVIGRVLRFNDRLHTVVGVLPDSMRTTWFAFNVDVWQPAQLDRARGGMDLRVFGRLKAGVTREQAQAELETLAASLEKNHSPNAAERALAPGGFTGARLAALDEQFPSTGRAAERIVLLLFTGTIIASVVGIAYFNMTILLLARIASRSRELAIRLAIGAGRVRIARQVLAETVLLAVLGGALGLLFSLWIAELLPVEGFDAHFDWRLYSFSAGTTLFVGILIGLLPALRSARTDLTEALKDGGQSVGRRHHRLRNFLISSEVAMALILCVVAGLVTRAFFDHYRGDLGFDPDKVISVQVDLRYDTYREMKDRHAYVERALLALRELSGVEAATVTVSGTFFVWSQPDLIVLEATDEDGTQTVKALNSFVSHGFIGAGGMKLLRGRDLADDSKKAEDEVLINEQFVAEHFRNADPLGHRIRVERENRWVTIVGITKNRHPRTTFQDLQAEAFFGYRRATAALPIVFLVQTRADARAMALSLRELLLSLDANQPVNQPAVVAELLRNRARGDRNVTMFLGILAGIGLFIALMGVYGVVAFSITERTREIGLRMALGATRKEVLRLLVWQGARLLLIGAVPGILIGSVIMLAMRLMTKGMDHLDISPFDPLTHLAVVLIVGSAGLLASALPARKAANLNPMEALRYE